MGIRLPLLIGAAIFLTACGTASEIQKGTPTIALNTSLQPDQVRDCLTQGETSIQVTPYEGGWRITEMTKGFTGPQEPVIWTAAVSPTGTGSHLALFHNWGPARPWETCVEHLPRA